MQNDLNRKLDAWIEATGDMGKTPESDEITAYWDENMKESFRESMKGRGLSPEISDSDYLATCSYLKLINLYCICPT